MHGSSEQQLSSELLDFSDLGFGGTNPVNPASSAELFELGITQMDSIFPRPINGRIAGTDGPLRHPALRDSLCPFDERASTSSTLAPVRTLCTILR